MSTVSDPYAAGGFEGEGVTFYAPEVLATVEEVEEDDSLTVPVGSVAEVLEWVGEDQERAQLALDAEKAGHSRKTLLKQLKDLV
jgi:hypothetical protein